MHLLARQCHAHSLVVSFPAPSIEALNAVNPGINPENLQIGQVINIPASDSDRGFGSLLAALLGGVVSPPFNPPHNNPTVPPPQAAPAGGGGQAMTGLASDITKATCIQLSGCQDDQTSADATIGGKPTGALSWAFLTAMAQMQRPTYEQLIVKIRQLLAGKFTQIPRGLTRDLGVELVRSFFIRLFLYSSWISGFFFFAELSSGYPMDLSTPFTI